MRGGLDTALCYSMALLMELTGFRDTEPLGSKVVLVILATMGFDTINSTSQKVFGQLALLIKVDRSWLLSQISAFWSNPQSVDFKELDSIQQ